MNNMKLTFLILRKNSKLLNEYINSNEPKFRSQYRNKIIHLKNDLASLSPKKYNLLKTIATDVDRFEIIMAKRQYEKKSNAVQVVIPNTDIILHRYHISSASSNYTHLNDPKILYDKNLDIYFIIYNDKTIVDNVTIFESSDHLWFKDVYYSVKEAKDSQEEILKQQKIIKDNLKLEQLKEGILNKYL